MTVRWATAAVLALTALAGAACGGDDEPPLLQGVSCFVYYRPLGDASTEGAVEDTVVLDLGDGSGSAEQTVDFETMSFRASVVLDEFEGDAISIAVNASDDETLASVLYQLGELDLAEVDFVGEHGFTGLHYVDHLGAQLQFACDAR